jgi:hypothetical protein
LQKVVSFGNVLVSLRFKTRQESVRTKIYFFLFLSHLFLYVVTLSLLGDISTSWKRGGPNVPPQKDFERLDHKNAIKHENREPPPRFSHSPKYPLKIIWKLLYFYVYHGCKLIAWKISILLCKFRYLNFLKFLFIPEKGNTKPGWWDTIF